MNERTVKDAYMEVVESQLETGDPPETKATLDRLMAEGRTLRGRPEALVAKALELDPANLRALEMAGSLAMEKGDPAQAARHWQLALDRLDPADPRRADLARAIARVGLAGPGGMTPR